ncbi:hypothetical protein FQN54_003122 [Arachnomyces sp. PD_36]|nr:hypothetical protein FQN54_003122 [Arachnomyces sp. PD_36]
MVYVKEADTEAYRKDARLRGSNLSAADREKLVKKYLPDPIIRQKSQKVKKGKNGIKSKKPQPIRAFVRSQFHYLVYFTIQIFFSIYIRLRQSYHAVVDRLLAILYYHHRTPELIQKDVKGLSRLPEHLSVLLTLKREDEALEILMDEVAELTAWTVCAGIPILSVYEKTGILKPYIPVLHRMIISKLSSYFGSAAHQPTLHLFAPHHGLYSPPVPQPTNKSNPASISVLLLSAADGRETLVDLTKTLAEMSQNGKLSPADISTELIDAEISEITSPPTLPLTDPSGGDTNQEDKESTDNTAPTNGNTPTKAPLLPHNRSEPDLLVIFGPTVKLDGYPPWQVRLTEIFCTGDKSSSISGGGEAVEYQGFLKALWRFARTEMRFGR